MADHKTVSDEKVTSVYAREGNGNIQITFTIPFGLIQKAQEETIAEMAQDIEIPGFRKGKAPIEKVKEKIPQKHVVEHALGHILPTVLTDAVAEHKLKIAIYPKFELVSANENEAWQIRAVTCELPEVNLGDYKKAITGVSKSGAIWTPDKGEADKKTEPTREEKENLVIKTLLETIKIEVPQILIEEEADSRLAGLLGRLEKLGLALEKYLESIGKKAEDLRAEYAKQAKEAISLDLALTKIAQEEKLIPDEKEVNSALDMAKATNPNDDPESRKRLIESILTRRKALDFLISLA